MYSTVIEIKRNVTEDTLSKLRAAAEKAFTNRAGNVKNSSKDPYKLVFKGDEKDYGCLDLGVAELGFTDGFLKQVTSWQWLDDDPRENCDVLKVYAARLGCSLLIPTCGSLHLVVNTRV